MIKLNCGAVRAVDDVLLIMVEMEDFWDVTLTGCWPLGFDQYMDGVLRWWR